MTDAASHEANSPDYVSAHMLRHYTDALTVGWYDDHDLPPDDLAEYAPLIDEVRRSLARQGDDDDGAFRVGLQYLLTKPNARLDGFAGGRYPYDADETREILSELYRVLYPDLPLPSVPPKVRVDWTVPVDEWWTRRGVNAPVNRGDTLESLAARHGLSVASLVGRNPSYARRYRPNEQIDPSDTVIRLRP